MDQKEQYICPACSKPIKIGLKFCTSCGSNLSEQLPIPVQNEQFICPACGKPAKRGHIFCMSCGANLNNGISTSSTQRSSLQLEIPEHDINFLNQAIDEKNRKPVLTFLENYLRILSNYDNIARKKIYDLIGIILTKDLKFFKHKIYSKLYKKADKLLSPQVFIEMEEYILKTYCFLKGEELITSIKGNVIFNSDSFEIRGRIYITNQRIIALGQYLTVSLTSGRDRSGHGGIEFPYMGGIRMWTSIPLFSGSDVVLPYGKKASELSRTLIHVDQVKRKRKQIIYDLKFEYEKKGKTKTRTDKLKFKLIKERGENEMDLEKRYEALLAQINDFMNSNLA